MIWMSGTTWLDELSLHSRDLDELDELELDEIWMSSTTWLDELSLHCSESFRFLLDSLVIPPSSSSSLNQQNIQLLNQEKKKVE